jgi:methyltransferase-like protein 6
MTMLRFEQEKRVGFREYMRSDGPRSYFFCLDTVRDLFVGVGFIEVLVLSLLLGCCKQLSLYSRFLWCMCSLSIRPAWLLPSNWN